MKIKKIGIITIYYKSTNYGANFQAYALSRVLSQQGYDAEQIAYCSHRKKKCFLKRAFSGGFIAFLRKSFRFAKLIIRYPFVCNEERKLNLHFRREKAFSHFNSAVIPHSRKVYNINNIAECVPNYDCFITGSDQVWNAWEETFVYFLSFVPYYKTKISYAASIARDFLTEEQKEIFRKNLTEYKAVSVREKSAEKLLEDLVLIDVQTVLDPTLLLTQEEWNAVCSPRVTDGDYILCYFLGDNKKERKIAEKFARLNNWKIVTIPHTAGIKLMDKRFGDEQLYDASPEQFISLVKHAKYIFTDSFHAVVFSNIYKKQYFVFNRNRKGEMSSRIFDITRLFHQEDRFCDTKDKERFEYVIELSDIDYTQENKDFEKLRAESFEFLEQNLKD